MISIRKRPFDTLPDDFLLNVIIYKPSGGSRECEYHTIHTVYDGLEILYALAPNTELYLRVRNRRSTVGVGV